MSFVSAIYLFGIFQGIILITVLISKYHVGINSKSFLIAFLILDVGYLSYQFCVYERYIEIYPQLIGSFLPLIFLIPPLFFQYIKYETAAVKPTTAIWPHLIPALVVLIVMTPYYYSSPTSKLELLFNHQHGSEIYPYRELLAVLMFISGAIYAGFSIHFSTSYTGKNAKWIKAFVLHFALLIFCLFASIILMKILTLNHRTIIATGVILFSLLVHFIGYIALMEPKFFSTNSNHKKGILSSKHEHISEEIVQILLGEKKFTQSDFTIRDLSRLLSTNENYLSATINELFGCNFPYLINSYRIEEAKRLIVNRNYDHFNFLGIATAVGFNNKNSFTRAFKRHTGITPSAFKAEILA